MTPESRRRQQRRRKYTKKNSINFNKLTWCETPLKGSTANFSLCYLYLYRKRTSASILKPSNSIQPNNNIKDCAVYEKLM